MDLKNKIHALAENKLEKVIAIRRHLHANPELSFEEYKTSEYICGQLGELGIPYKNGFVKTGIVGVIEGSNPSAKVIALRADMDALPIIEANDIPYQSNNKGVMHACGHDAHTASLLGAATILNELKSEFEGTIKLIFQPGEEKLPGGASLMIEAGALQNPTPTSMFGQHVYPELPAGKVGFKSGKYMASTDELYITIKGKGGHAALPHYNIDPVLISAHIITALQQVVSRSAKPDTPTVLSFGKVTANGATNVIPTEVKLEGTFRTFDEEWRNQAHRKIEEIAVGTAKSMGGDCEIEIRKGYPFLVNDEVITNKAQQHAIDYLGKESVVELDLRMTAEDFAYYSHLMPTCFYRLGVGESSGLHTPTFNIDEKALQTGIGLMAWLALNELKS